MKAKLLLLAALAALVIVALFLQKQTGTEEETPADLQTGKQTPPMSRARPTFKPGKVASVKTNRGVFRFALYEEDMPITCKNFVALVNRGFYKGLKFHRVEDWVVQTGDPKGDGTGGSGKTIKLEVKPGMDFAKPYAVAMARKELDPNSATSQFFVTRKPAAGLNGQYALFGRVFDGQEVVDKIKQGDVVQEITLSLPSGGDMRSLLQAEELVPGPESEHHDD